MTVEILLAGLVGLIVGSFLCLVAHRLPVMLEEAWVAYCAETTPGEVPPTRRDPYNLLRPPSHCPACGHRLGPLENIPLLSWAAQGGRCRACGVFIGWREPLVELTAAALAMLAVWRFGASWDAAFAAVFMWMLLLASVIDMQRGWLPDELTQPLLWLGLLANLGGRFVTPEDAVIGAVAGYVSLWLVYWGFRLIAQREGMGLGDLHLLAAIGAWTGWQPLPGLVLLAAATGLVWAAIACLVLGRSRADPMPFGPMLALGGVMALLWPERLLSLLTHGLAT